MKMSLYGPVFRLSRVALVALTSVASLSCARQAVVVSTDRANAVATSAVYPVASWDSIADPASVGWSRAGLDSVRLQLAALPTTGFMAIVGGRVLMSHGDLQAVSYLASVRKSVLSMLIGNYVRRGVIDLNRTLAQLGMDDIGGLTDDEKQATVLDLLTARSGVYHAASNAGDDLASAPPRGSQKPGTYHLYSNWDFNALGGAFELMTGRDIYDALETDIARPIGMEDFNRAVHRKTGDSTRSQYLAYHMNFSTRDMARVGYLMLRRGNWNGSQVIPAEWVDESTRPFTPVSAMNPPARRTGPFGYGYLWWVWDGPRATGAYEGAYTGLGAIGQHITVMPKLDLVVVHKTRPGQRDSAGLPRTVPHAQYQRVLDALVRAGPSPQKEFWSALQRICGKSFLGSVAESSPPDTVMSRATLQMHVRECGGDTIRIPFHVGSDRSRTWVLTRTGSGLRLKHDHRHEDGSEDAVTQYGGDTRTLGSATRQEFFADEHTAALIPAARTNIWTMEVVPGERFVYALRREGTERRFRAEFDLTRPVPAPPAPWGHR